ncbi:MAG: hypothetical protein ACD_71C00180G0004, partial [uncultured bacterium (gcode 4)]
RKYGFDNGETLGESSGVGNKIIHGDNLEALKALLPEYEGRVKCIYIDPPYNTGNEWWAYNDSVNDPKIKKWLGQVVGKEFEDLTRHDKWLCMMYPRLKLLHRLLSDDWGVIMISIADHEMATLKILMDEIFWINNFLCQFIWDNDWNIDNQSKIKVHHEYILTYGKKVDSIEKPVIIDPNIEESSKLYNDSIENSITKNGPKNPSSVVILPVWFPATFEKWVINAQSENYPIIHEDLIIDDFKLTRSGQVESGWSSKNLLLLFINNWFEPIQDSEGKETTFKITQSWAIYCYKKRSWDQGHVLSIIRNVWTTKQTSNFLKSLWFNFSYPKPIYLVQYLLEVFTKNKKDAIILDSFAWSWTTAHAVLNLNKKDDGNRKFILVEMEDYAETITAERIKHVVTGGIDLLGTGGGFDYFTLGQPLLDSEWNLNPSAGIERIRAYVAYTETAIPYDPVAPKVVNHPYFLVRSIDRDHYFYYKLDAITILDATFLKTVTVPSNSYSIWADKCSLSEDFLRDNNITFRKIPRDIRKL